MDFNAHYGVVIHQNFTPLYADDTYANIFGYNNAQEILALTSILDLIDPEQQDVASHIYYALMSGIEKPQVRNYINRNRLGEVINVLAIEHIVEWQGRPALQITIVDISESIKIKQSLQQSENRYLQLVHGSVQGVVVHRNFTPIYCNQAFAHLLGYPNTQSILDLGSILDLIDPTYQERRLDANAAFLANKEKPYPVEIKCLHHNGNTIWVKILESVIHWEGLPAIQITMTDVTEVHLLKQNHEKYIYIDPLTQVLNRRGLMHFSKSMIKAAKPKVGFIYCVILGIDELKQINHLYGYEAGDRALIHFAQHCHSKLADEDIFARWSGDEFIAMIKADNNNIARNIAESIRHSIDDTELIDLNTTKQIRFSACVGISKWQPSDTLDSLILRTDSALEQARSQTTNQLVMN